MRTPFRLPNSLNYKKKATNQTKVFKVADSTMDRWLDIIFSCMMDKETNTPNEANCALGTG